MSRNYVVSTRKAMFFAQAYDNGEKKPGLSLNWRTGQKQPMSIKSMQGVATKRVNNKVSLAPIPESRILTKEDLK